MPKKSESSTTEATPAVVTTTEEPIVDWTGRQHEASRDCWCKPEVETYIADGLDKATVKHNGNLSPEQEFNLVLNMEDVRSTKYRGCSNLMDLVFQATGEASTYTNQPELLIAVAEGIVQRTRELAQERLIEHFANRLELKEKDALTPAMLRKAEKWATEVLEGF